MSWKNLWSKKYPVLNYYDENYIVENYEDELEKLYDSFKTEFKTSDVDTLIIMKGIIYNKYLKDKNKK